MSKIRKPLKTVTLKVTDLKGEVGNPRRIPGGHIKELTITIERWGDLAQTLVSPRTGHVVVGHRRLEVMGAARARKVGKKAPKRHV